ncbi:MAG: VWA domain-containing protein [Anaerolineae bacterium]|nr:VWA domain-containing protein [Anaerolineae bacterium]
MFEMGGIGSDPHLLRLDAARLFLSYLGVDEPDQIHQAGIIFFGSIAETAVPLTPLTDDNIRAQLFVQIANPTRMGWTDHLAALELAQSQLSLLNSSHRPVIILLTDGKPEWSQTPDPVQQAAYITALENKGAELAAAGISLFIVLLANEATDDDPEIVILWQPLWQALSEATPTGHFYVARTANALPDIYHAIVVSLTDRESAGVVVETAVTATAQTLLQVPPGLTQMTLVIGKSSPTQTIRIETPDKLVLDEAQPGVRQSGGDGQSREEIWVIEQPLSGTWVLHLTGNGNIHVWQDFVRASRPLPSPTAPEGMATAPTDTPLPVIAAPTAVLVDIVTLTTAPTTTKTQPVEEVTATLASPNEPLPAEVSHAGSFPWLLVGLLLLGVTTVVLYRRQRRATPLVAGTLRLLGQARTGDGQTVIDLDRLNRPVVTLGKPPADVPLPGAMTQAIIYPGVLLTADTYEMRLNARGELWFNGNPLHGEAVLTDTAVINFGDVEVRYENLRLRRIEREMQEMRD